MSRRTNTQPTVTPEAEVITPDPTPETIDQPTDPTPDTANVPADMEITDDDAPEGTDVPTLATVEAYRVADTKGKAAIRKAAQEAMNKAVDDLDLPAAKAAKDALASYTSAPKTKVDTTDYASLLANRAATLRLAARLIEARIVTPDGTPDGVARVAGKASSTVASRLAATKVARVGTKADLGGLMVSVATTEFATVAQVRHAIATVTEGAYVPSDGAIAARLFPTKGTCTLKGITPVEATGTQPRGMKLA